MIEVPAGTVGNVTAIVIDPSRPLPMPDDAYPALYGDQRTMLEHGLECETAEDVFWKCWLPHLALHQPGLVPVLDSQEVIPYLNASRWIANCPACRNAMACWDQNPYACCLGYQCGRIFKVRWQLPALRSEVMRLLAGWPEGNRNWNAHEGETLEELKIQGVLMLGVEPALRNGLLVADNVHVPDEFTDANEYLDSLRRARRD